MQWTQKNYNADEGSRAIVRYNGVELELVVVPPTEKGSGWSARAFIGQPGAHVLIFDSVAGDQPAKLRTESDARHWCENAVTSLAYIILSEVR